MKDDLRDMTFKEKLLLSTDKMFEAIEKLLEIVEANGGDALEVLQRSSELEIENKSLKKDLSRAEVLAKEREDEIDRLSDELYKAKLQLSETVESAPQEALENSQIAEEKSETEENSEKPEEEVDQVSKAEDCPQNEERPKKRKIGFNSWGIPLDLLENSKFSLKKLQKKRRSKSELTSLFKEHVFEIVYQDYEYGEDEDLIVEFLDLKPEDRDKVMEERVFSRVLNTGGSPVLAGLTKILEEKIPQENRYKNLIRKFGELIS
ncbi:hypothetical protein C0584_04050 [Candidatus Parcubacteria bacterium]|mgnify:CR=1 FL=1|nr:MAG: hypothetical protein C0584_04050 [Candidatus Parcubacteria bacterium]